jgi:cyclopropane fatty-acyl-phospholipid synthase-like methyltransferase
MVACSGSARWGEAARVSADALHPFADTETYIEFLERPDRAVWQKPDEVVSALHLAGTETLVDVGAGSGYFTFRFAKVLPKGKVIAVDVQPEMVRHIHHKVITEGITNVQAVLADPTDPSVDPSADVVSSRMSSITSKVVKHGFGGCSRRQRLARGWS